MDKGQKEALVRHVRAGHDTEAACAMLGIPMVEIRRGGKKLQNELSDAFATGSARLRSRLLEGVLGGDGDLRMLANVLEHREATQTASAAKNGVDAIRIQIVDARCPHCGRQPYPTDTANGEAHGLPGDVPVPEPAEESAEPAKQPFVRRYGPSVRMGGI